jgi:hypothetical protein
MGKKDNRRTRKMKQIVSRKKRKMKIKAKSLLAMSKTA